MITLAASARPAIVHGVLLPWEAAQEAVFLLYPEGTVKLNRSGAAILSDGVRTVAVSVADLERSYCLTGLSGDVTSFLAFAGEKRWVELGE